MGKKDKNLPFKAPFSKLGLLNVSLPADISAAARQIDYLLGYEYGNLIILVRSIDYQDLSSIKVWLEKARITYENCLDLLREVVDTKIQKLPATYESDIAKAQNHLQSLLNIKETIITTVLNKATPVSGKAIQESVPNLPTEQKAVIKSPPLYSSVRTLIKTKTKIRQSTLATNLDPVITLDLSDVNIISTLKPVEVVSSKTESEHTDASYQVPKPEPEILSPQLKNIPKTFLLLSEVRTCHYSLSGELLAVTLLADICLQGLNIEDLNITPLSNEKVSEIYSVLKQKINDLLTARPNFSQSELEVILFKKLEKIYGAEDWWKVAQINEVKIGLIETTKTEKIVPASEETATEVVAVESNSLIQTVPVETIKTPLVPVLATAHTKRNDLGAIENVSDHLINNSNIVHTQRGALAIGEEDAGIRLVPIKFRTLVASNEVNEEKVEAPFEVPAVRVIDYRPLEKAGASLFPPDLNHHTATGNYTKSPEFVEYVNSEYGSVKKFNRLILKEALAIENETYDGFNRWLNEYKSPYEMVLSKMTVGDIENAFSLPHYVGRVDEVDTTGLPEYYDSEAIRQYATDSNFKYETLRQWLIKLEDLKNEFPHQDTTTLEDLLARSIIKKDFLALEVQTERV